VPTNTVTLREYYVDPTFVSTVEGDTVKCGFMLGGILRDPVEMQAQNEEDAASIRRKLTEMNLL